MLAAGYSVRAAGPAAAGPANRQESLSPLAGEFTRRVLGLLGLVFGVVLLVVVVGEWLGLLERLTERVPLPLGALIAGWPVFHNVLRAALQRQVIAHTRMSVGVLAALAVGQWASGPRPWWCSLYAWATSPSASPPSGRGAP